MVNKIRIWIKYRFFKIVNSIAFYPALIALAYLIISGMMIAFDFSATGKNIKSQLSWLSLKDATTARSIISSIVAGIISLTVFSFSMVMIILNQAASQMSNRILDKLIGNRFQQIVLGIYIGTIVYALFLLSTIRDIDSGIYIPALSTYLLIVLTIIDIFLFIYFLHYITQTVKYEVIIERIFKETHAAMEQSCTLTREPGTPITLESNYLIYSQHAGTYEGFNKHSLLNICDKHDFTMILIHPVGAFILKDIPVIKVSKHLPEEVIKDIRDSILIHNAQSIDNNYFYGFRQLMEVAVKALSPGINDPGTAVESLKALFKLFTYRLQHSPQNSLLNKDKKIRIITTELSFEKIFADTIYPIWDYGKKDRVIQQELFKMLTQLQSLHPTDIAKNLLQLVDAEIQKNELI